MSCARFPASVLSIEAGHAPGETVLTIEAETSLGPTLFAIALQESCVDQLVAALPLVRSGQVGRVTALAAGHGCEGRNE